MRVAAAELTATEMRDRLVMEHVPLVKTMCPEIDVAARRIIVDPPEGLLEVNVGKVGK